MGVWVSLVFGEDDQDENRDSDVDSGVDEYPGEPPPTRQHEEESLAVVCRLVHDEGVTLMMYLTANPRDNVDALCRSIGEQIWTEEAQSVLKTIWNSIAGRWFCAAVEFDEEKNDVVPDSEAVQDTVALEVPWDKAWSITDCALLIRSNCLTFSVCNLHCVRHCQTWIRLSLLVLMLVGS
jgi:hypothetical protein